MFSYVRNNPTNRVDPSGLQPPLPGPDPQPAPKPGSGIQFVEGVPSDAVKYTIPGTNTTFWAPPEENFQEIYRTGQNDASNSLMHRPLQMKHENDAVGHFGKYDCQRKWISKEQGTFYFYKQYSNAANYNVGIYLAGLGFTEQEALDEVHLFQGAKRTGNAGSSLVDQWTKLGWEAAHSGHFAIQCPR